MSINEVIRTIEPVMSDPGKAACVFVAFLGVVIFFHVINQ